MSSTFYRFLEAVRVGTTEEVGAMLDLEPTLINRYDASRRSALVWAAHRRGRLEVMRLLLSRGADVNYVDGKGDTALYHALGRAECEAYVRLLLQHGANPRAVNETGQPLLACAADHVDLSTVRLLVHAIDDRRLPRLLNYRLNPEGETPLCRACRKGDLTRASFLLLELDADYKMEDFANNTPLQTAIRYGNLQCAELIQRYPGYLELPYVLHRARCVYEDGDTRHGSPPAYLHTRVLPQVELLPIWSVEGGLGEGEGKKTQPAKCTTKEGPRGNGVGSVAAKEGENEAGGATRAEQEGGGGGGKVAASSGEAVEGPLRHGKARPVDHGPEGEGAEAQTGKAIGGEEGEASKDLGNLVKEERASAESSAVPASVGGGKRKREEEGQEAEGGKEGGSREAKEEEEEVGAVLGYVVKEMNRELYTELLWGLRLRGEQRVMGNRRRRCVKYDRDDMSSDSDSSSDEEEDVVVVERN